MSRNVSVNALGDTTDLTHVLAQTKPRAMVIMNDLGAAHRLTASLPNTIVIFRDWSLGDSRHLTMTPQQFVNVCKTQYNGAANLWFYTTNEQGFSKDNMDWHLEVLRLAPDYLKFVGMNPGIGTYPDSKDSWAYAEYFLRKISEERHRFILGLHEYAGGVPNSGMPDFTNRVQDWSGPVMPAYHVGRFRYMEQFCASIGIKPPRVVITEHGFDDLNDISSWLKTLRVKAGYYNIRGWKTLTDQWLEWYGQRGWTAQMALWKAVEWMDKYVYANSCVEAQCIYCWGHNGDPSWDQFDVSEAGTYIENWIAYANGSAPNANPSPVPPSLAPASPPAPFISGIPYKIDVPQTYVNLRDIAGIPSNIIGKVYENDIVTAIEETLVGNDYWRKVQTKLGIQGWIAMQWSPTAGCYGVQMVSTVTPSTFRDAVSTAKVNVNIRKNASAASPKLGLIKVGSTFRTNENIVRPVAEGQWLEVRTSDGQIGWASLNYLQFKLIFEGL